MSLYIIGPCSTPSVELFAWNEYGFGSGKMIPIRTDPDLDSQHWKIIRKNIYRIKLKKCLVENSYRAWTNIITVLTWLFDIVTRTFLEIVNFCFSLITPYKSKVISAPHKVLNWNFWCEESSVSSKQIRIQGYSILPLCRLRSGSCYQAKGWFFTFLSFWIWIRIYIGELYLCVHANTESIRSKHWLAK